MSLLRLRLETSLREPDGRWRLEAEEGHHLTVRRCSSGDRVEGLLPGCRVVLRLERQGNVWYGQEEECHPDEGVPVRITLLAGILKEDAWDTLLRVATEVGVCRILPLLCTRSVPRWEGARLAARLERWRRILAEATKQCGASEAPELMRPQPVDALEEHLLPPDRFAALLSGDARPLPGEPFGDDVALAIGPEGDFTSEEGESLRHWAFRPISLGERVLRAPTAVAVGCAWFGVFRGGVGRERP